MVYAALLLLTVFVAAALTDQICTSSDHLRIVEKGKLLPDPGSPVKILTTSGIMTCAKACLNRKGCESFNYNIQTNECQLSGASQAKPLINHRDFVFSSINHWSKTLAGSCANHTCPLNSYCDSVAIDGYDCIITGCLDSPPVDNGHINESKIGGESVFGTILSYICDPGYMARGEVVCQNNGTWSSPVCVSVSSCSEVKQYQPGSEDEEYWLRLTNFNNYTTQIYCENMSSNHPEEFVTLHSINYGVYPKESNSRCVGKRNHLRNDCGHEGGEIWFRKIRVNITTMGVYPKDFSWANYTGFKRFLEYGSAFDCYTPHQNNSVKCGTRGRFTIDLRGTGWRVKANQKWHSVGWKSMIESIDKQMNDTFVSLHCGGYGGGCKPTGGLFLSPSH